MNHDHPAYRLAHCAQQLAIRKRKRKQQAAARLQTRPLAQSTESQRSPSQLAGHQAELLAAQHVNNAGLRLLNQNLRCKAGEIDLLAVDDHTLVFIEVRQRQSQRYGGAAASVNRHKQQRLIHAARYFLPQLTQRHFGGRPPPCRFDVICIEPSGLVWIKQAFDGS